jgi:hypothetical protein
MSLLLLPLLISTASTSSTSSTAKLGTHSQLVPLAVRLAVAPPKNWRFEAPQGAALQSLIQPGFQGHVEALQKNEANSSIYEVNVFAFKRDAQLQAAEQIKAAFEAVFPNTKIANAKVSEVRKNNDLFFERTIEVPYGSSAITTLLHARVGPQTVVVIEAVVSGHDIANAALETVRAALPQFVYRLGPEVK